MKRFNDNEKVKEIGFLQELTVIHTTEDKINGNTVDFYWIRNGIEYYGELPERKLTEYNPTKTYSKKEVLQIVDSCFHMFASSERNEAETWALELMERDNLKQA